MGNRVEIVGVPVLNVDGVEIQEEERVRVLGIHHKNDSRGGAGQQQQGPIDVTLPLGSLNDMLLFWIREGWGTITSSSPELFRSRVGQSFSNSTFTQYWETLMKSAQPLGLPYFPPNLGRTSYIERYTRGERILI